jgi:hypothetical protein
MKKIIVISLLTILSFNLMAQEVERKNTKWNTLDGVEVFLSANTTLGNNGRLGFGGGINFALLKNNPFNLIIGIDYNHIVQKVYFFSGGHSPSDYLNNGSFMSYNGYSSFPNLIARYNFGKRTKLFIELGCYAEVPLYSYSKRIEDGEYIKDNFGVINFGLIGGLGLKIPLNDKYKILVKVDYKHGLNEYNDYDYINKYCRFVLGFVF